MAAGTKAPAGLDDLPSAPSRTLGDTSVTSSTAYSHLNAPTISLTQIVLQSKRETLL
jgi:hypothetical protein